MKLEGPAFIGPGFISKTFDYEEEPRASFYIFPSESRRKLPFTFALCEQQVEVGVVYAPDLMNFLPSLMNAGGAWSDHITKFRGITYFQPQEILDIDMPALEAEFSMLRPMTRIG